MNWKQKIVLNYAVLVIVIQQTVDSCNVVN